MARRWKVNAKLPDTSNLTLDEVLAHYRGKGGGWLAYSTRQIEILEKQLIKRGLALAKTKSELNDLLQVVLATHEAEELKPKIFAQIMSILRRVEELPRRQRRLSEF